MAVGECDIAEADKTFSSVHLLSLRHVIQGHCHPNNNTKKTGKAVVSSKLTSGIQGCRQIPVQFFHPMKLCLFIGIYKSMHTMQSFRGQNHACVTLYHTGNPCIIRHKGTGIFRIQNSFRSEMLY